MLWRNAVLSSRVFFYVQNEFLLNHLYSVYNINEIVYIYSENSDSEFSEFFVCKVRKTL